MENKDEARPAAGGAPVEAVVICLRKFIFLFFMTCAFYGDRIGIILTDPMETEGGTEWVFAYSRAGLEKVNFDDLTMTSCSRAIDYGGFSREQLEKLNAWFDIPGYQRDPFILSR